MGKLPICRSFIFETCWLPIATERLDIPSRSSTPRIHSSCALFHQWKDIRHQQNGEYVFCCLKPFSMNESRMRICVALIHMKSRSTSLPQSLESHSFSSRGCKMLKTPCSLEHVALPIYGHETRKTRDTQSNFLPCFTINCFGYIPGSLVSGQAKCIWIDQPVAFFQR